MEIKVGDAVTWVRQQLDGKRFSGIVQAISGETAIINTLDEPSTRKYVDAKKLQRLDIVAAIAAKPLDEAVREQVVHDLRSACDGDDYNAVRWAGSLGSVEL